MCGRDGIWSGLPFSVTPTAIRHARGAARRLSWRRDMSGYANPVFDRRLGRPKDGNCNTGRNFLRPDSPTSTLVVQASSSPTAQAQYRASFSTSSTYACRITRTSVICQGGDRVSDPARRPAQFNARRAQIQML